MVDSGGHAAAAKVAAAAAAVDAAGAEAGADDDMGGSNGEGGSASSPAAPSASLSVELLREIIGAISSILLRLHRLHALEVELALAGDDGERDNLQDEIAGIDRTGMASGGIDFVFVAHAISLSSITGPEVEVSYFNLCGGVASDQGVGGDLLPSGEWRLSRDACHAAASGASDPDEALFGWAFANHKHMLRPDEADAYKSAAAAGAGGGGSGGADSPVNSVGSGSGAGGGGGGEGEKEECAIVQREATFTFERSAEEALV
jgi:hypothetical protein